MYMANKELIYCNLYCIVIMYQIDALLRYFQPKNQKESIRWFQLHAIINMIITALTASDILECMQDPTRSNDIVETDWPRSLALSLHIYHCLAYTPRIEDWYHHIISVFLCAPMCIMNNTKAIAFNYFFCTGFPGGIDYIMLSLVKTNHVTRMTQKYMASLLNAYIRMPGGCIGAYLIFKDAFQPAGIRIDRIALSMIMYGNSTFYGRQAICSYGEANIKTNRINKALS